MRRLAEQLNDYLKQPLRDHLSVAKTSWQLCILALISAMLASIVIILLRLLLEWTDTVTHAQIMDFTGIATDWRVLLPLFGAILIRLVAKLGSRRYKRLGIAYVIHRYKLHYGKLPLQSAAAQFFQAFFALASNFSVGREGPAIHLGAVTASVIAAKMRLPNNSVRIMCASGIAAGIAATFNAPLAAVIFVFEVIVREYKLHYFFPIMLSALVGAVSSQLVFGNIHEYDSINVIHIPVTHYPLLAIVAIALGIFAALFNRTLVKVTALSQPWGLSARLLLAGIITSAIGLLLPQALGTGDLAIEVVISEHPGMLFLLALLAAKCIATIAAIGLGIPGGLIGPLYGIGALIGTIFALISAWIFPELTPFIGLYTVIGMTAMMGVCLGAPLAGLTALLELTNDATIIMPAMFVTVLAYLVAYQGLKTDSIFLKQIELMGLGYKKPPLHEALEKVGVRALMNRRFVIVNQDQALLLEVLKRAEGRPVMIKDPQGQINMLHLSMPSVSNESPLIKEVMQGLEDNATLKEAYESLALKRRGELYIWQSSPDNIVGVISWQQLQQHIRAGQA
nr:chloride channel protein [Shewanella sp. NIFS-20-20]